MATKPGYLTGWPWQHLGNCKYVVVAPLAMVYTYKFLKSGSEERDLLSFLALPVMLLRLMYAQLWITISRYQTARSKHRIVNKSIDFNQVDRESNWDDQAIFVALLIYTFHMTLPMARGLPWWDSNGLAVVSAMHAGPVEFLYYWFHRALHHHYLYSRYHSHHHASIVTEPITAVIHPFAEELVYFALFAIPVLTAMATNTASVAVTILYLIYIDTMNYLGHCNFEFVPKWLFDAFPLLKYLMYTPTFHSLHHTQFRTNYSLFMPFYDYLYGTLDASSDHLYQRALQRRSNDDEEGKGSAVDVVHLTHLTTPESIFHLRLGFASLASAPLAATTTKTAAMPKLVAPLLVPLTSLLGRTAFRSEANRFKNLKIETWVVPRNTDQYMSKGGVDDAVSRLIEKAVLDTEASGARVLTLGLLNQTDEQPVNVMHVRMQGYDLNRLYISRKPSLRTKIVDGTSLAAAAVIHMIPEGTKAVLLLGNTNNKMSAVLTHGLCERGIRVEVVDQDLHECLSKQLPSDMHKHLVLSRSYGAKVWLVGDGLIDDGEQKKAQEGVHFLPYSQFPPKPLRNDCIYHSTPAFLVPESFQNLHACENWLPRRVMSVWRVAGIVHALENWDSHECGGRVTGVDKAWRAALAHGFRPYDTTPQLLP
ncbi:hypothetical protein U9M48_013989 [Paspalum notatum var. saurae]|uniref:aldehyde oxygenase (deformylating) n=1 Tax=Paspalum notatum var. saurae TaxID=547442 RepID=A0AAQ3WK24_PASNO